MTNGPKVMLQTRIAGLLLLAGAWGIAPLADPGKTQPPSGKADDPLVGILAHFDSAQSQIHTLTASFTETKKVALLKEPVSSKGKFYYTHPNDVLWEYVEPTPRVFLIRRNELLAYYPTQKRAEQLDISRYQTRLLKVLGIGQVSNDLKKYYDISLAQDVPKSEGYVLVLTPRRRMIKKKIEEVRFWVDPKSYLPVKMEYREGDGDSTTIAFEEIQLNPTIDEATYRIDLPPGVTVEHSFTGLGSNKGAS